MADAAREPDKDLSRWIIEFLLRQPTVSGPLLKRVIWQLNSVAVIDSDWRLKKRLELKLIQSEISKGSVSEKILDSLEVIEKLDRECGKLSIPETMKIAYCAVALACTVREGVVQFDAVERIWRGRIQNLESFKTSELLVTDELKRFRDDVEAPVWDTDACRSLLEWSEQNDAVKLVRVYVEEAKAADDEPSFLELAAARWNNMDTGAEQVHDNAEQPVSQSPASDARKKKLGYNIEKVVHFKRSKSQARVRQIQVALGGSCSLELLTSVNDAPHVSESFIAEGPRDVLNVAKPVENQNEENAGASQFVPSADATMPELRNKTSNLDVPAEKGNGKEGDGPGPFTHQDLESIQTDKRNVAIGGSMHHNVTRNTTACAHEWDDSVSSLSEETSDDGRRTRIKRRKREVVPSLTKDDWINVARRRKRRWSVEEEDALREGVNEFGRGCWKAILDSRLVIFAERTEVDLKDKWRNMTEDP